MYDSRFLQPVNMEMEQFPATKQSIQQRLEHLIEHHHYWTKLEGMAKNIHKNPEDKTVRNQQKLKQLHVRRLICFSLLLFCNCLTRIAVLRSHCRRHCEQRPARL